MTSGQATSFALIMFLTGVGIPILAALNGGLGARPGSPMAGSVILFGLSLLIALAGAAATESLGDVRRSSGVPPPVYIGGLFVAFYRSEYRLVGDGWVSTCRSLWW